MNLIKLKNGTFAAAYPHDHDEAAKLPVGTEVKATQARNPEFFRKGMALLRLGHENQDKYESFEIYRKVQTIKAGFFDMIPGKDGTLHPLPHSISFEKMKEEEFKNWFDAVLRVISEELKTAPEIVRGQVEEYY